MNQNCPYCKTKNSSSESHPCVVRFGYFYRKNDQALVQRFLCRDCQRSFSVATEDPCCWQKKRTLNEAVFLDLVSGVSMRQTARKLKINHKTVVRKFLFLGHYSLKMIPIVNTLYPRSAIVEFDDLETFEHTKCKPLSATIAVEYKSRRILGFRVSVMPAKGLLAEISRKKYGKRKDERKAQRRALFAELSPFIQESAVIKSDENPHYQSDVKEFFPGSEHRVFLGKRGCVTGQGELKRGGFDPLFTLNHTYAMIRDHIKRLSRRTWCTTKKKERLALHIAIYTHYHNLVLIRKKKKGPLQLGPFASSTI